MGRAAVIVRAPVRAYRAVYRRRPDQLKAIYANLYYQGKLVNRLRGMAGRAAAGQLLTKQLISVVNVKKPLIGGIRVLGRTSDVALTAFTKEGLRRAAIAVSRRIYQARERLQARWLTGQLNEKVKRMGRSVTGRWFGVDFPGFTTGGHRTWKTPSPPPSLQTAGTVIRGMPFLSVSQVKALQSHRADLWSQFPRTISTTPSGTERLVVRIPAALKGSLRSVNAALSRPTPRILHRMISGPMGVLLETSHELRQAHAPSVITSVAKSLKVHPVRIDLPPKGRAMAKTLQGSFPAVQRSGGHPTESITHGVDERAIYENLLHQRRAANAARAYMRKREAAHVAKYTSKPKVLSGLKNLPEPVYRQKYGRTVRRKALPVLSEPLPVPRRQPFRVKKPSLYVIGGVVHRKPVQIRK